MVTIRMLVDAGRHQSVRRLGPGLLQQVGQRLILCCVAGRLHPSAHSCSAQRSTKGRRARRALPPYVQPPRFKRSFACTATPPHRHRQGEPSGKPAHHKKIWLTNDEITCLRAANVCNSRLQLGRFAGPPANVPKMLPPRGLPNQPGHWADSAAAASAVGSNSPA